MITRIAQLTAATAMAFSLASPAHANAVQLNFDGIAAGAAADTDPAALAAGISFHNAAWLPDLDEDGIEIPGSEHWQIDPSVPDLVTAENTVVQEWGAAPSGQNALDARWSPILLSFASPTDIGGFSFTLPDSTFGNLFPTDVLFFDAAGNTLATLSYFQGQPLATIALSTAVLGVKDVLLASGTFYDDINVAAVPLPAAVWLFAGALAGLGCRFRRREAC